MSTLHGIEEETFGRLFRRGRETRADRVQLFGNDFDSLFGVQTLFVEFLPLAAQLLNRFARPVFPK